MFILVGERTKVWGSKTIRYRRSPNYKLCRPGIGWSSLKIQSAPCEKSRVFRFRGDGGAWSFLVGGAICLVNSDNGRDLDLLTSGVYPIAMGDSQVGVFSLQQWSGFPRLASKIKKLLRGTTCLKQAEVRGNNRSVMPLDTLGRTRATLRCAKRLPGPEGLGNQEFITVSHYLTLNMSLPFVHTARRSYRSNDTVKPTALLAGLTAGLAIMLFKPHCLEEGEVVTRYP
eukprot:gene2363-2919_t